MLLNMMQKHFVVGRRSDRKQKSIKHNQIKAVLMLRQTFCCMFQTRRYSSGFAIFETLTACLVRQSPGTDANKWNKVTLWCSITDKKATIVQMQQPVSQKAAAVHLLKPQAGGDDAAPPDLSAGLILHVVKRLR